MSRQLFPSPDDDFDVRVLADIREVLHGYEVRFGAVSDERRLELLTYADRANRRGRFEAIQVILPDSSGRWPEEPGYHSHAQPLLDCA